MNERVIRRSTPEESGTVPSNIKVDARLPVFYVDDSASRTSLKWAILGTAVVHIILFAVNLPTVRADMPEPEEDRLGVLRLVKFERPKPVVPPERPPQPTDKRREVAVPDLTPDGPEPIEREERVEHELDWQVDELAGAIPEAPLELEHNGPISVGGDVRAPQKIFAPQPRYTEAARRAGVRGAAIVQAVIDREGRVTAVTLLKDLPLGLGRSAADAIAKWKFEPATLNGKPVAVYYNLTVHFGLR